MTEGGEIRAKLDDSNRDLGLFGDKLKGQKFFDAREA